MAVKIISEENLKHIRNNEFVLSATSRRISYSQAFKKYFVEKYREGIKPTEIFKMAGFDVEVLGYKRIEKASERWISENGVTLHKDEPNIKRLEVKIARQQKEIERLNSELEKIRKQARV